ncbi:hypothetical protein GDO78_000356 [Eleutherodactylus coqui]|uniref:Trafficking protein particle complex subunit n=1 Tax=Eleutherodactylus coqui TaxID=57060 RepID=A0A8J6FSA4_ELECQ|nr:hypothetical protein GDO78_000356 [Eleutherodactylus coqui]
MTDTLRTFCLHYTEWNRRKQARISKLEEFKLMYGMLFSIRYFSSNMSPVDMKDDVLSFQTSKYKPYYYKTPSGLKMVMNTDLSVDPVQSELFESKLDSYIQSLPYFSAWVG